MSVYFYSGHVLEVLGGFDDGTFQMCVTSPPYWGLRKYSTNSVAWGGDSSCNHGWGEAITTRKRGAAHGPNADVGATKSGISGTSLDQGAFCTLCGAWLGELGMEPTPELYVQHLTEIFREVRRVLRDDGVLWLNIGDSHAGSGGPGSLFTRYSNPNRQVLGIKPKDLVGIPWMLAFSLRSDGWYLRSDCIWHKPNVKPESVKDRPTVAHEHMFLLSKSMRYYYDCDAVAEPAVSTHGSGNRYKRPESLVYQNADGSPRGNDKPWRPRNIEGEFSSRGVTRTTEGLNLKTQAEKTGSTRNLRDVWTISTKPFRGAHFATYPTVLVEPCIKSGSSEAGNCSSCGAPARRIVDRKSITSHTGTTATTYEKGSSANRLALLRQASREAGEEYTNQRETVGWETGCSCGVDTVPALILDPFIGSGTTALVAHQLGRDCIGIDLNPDYLSIAEQRLLQEGIEVCRI